MAYCSSCGELIPEEVKFCPYCGKAVNKKFSEPIKQVAASELYDPLTKTSKLSEQVVYSDESSPKDKRANGFSIAGFVLSLTFIFSWIGLVFGAIGLGFSKKLKSGKGLGLAAVIIGGLITLVYLCFLIPTLWDTIVYGVPGYYVFDAIFIK